MEVRILKTNQKRLNCVLSLHRVAIVESDAERKAARTVTIQANHDVQAPHGFDNVFERRAGALFGVEIQAGILDDPL